MVEAGSGEGSLTTLLALALLPNSPTERAKQGNLQLSAFSPPRHRDRLTRGYEAYPPTELGDEKKDHSDPHPCIPPSPSPRTDTQTCVVDPLCPLRNGAGVPMPPSFPSSPLPHDQEEGQRHPSLVLGRMAEHHPLSQTKLA